MNVPSTTQKILNSTAFSSTQCKQPNAGKISHPALKTDLTCLAPNTTDTLKSLREYNIDKVVQTLPKMKVCPPLTLGTLLEVYKDLDQARRDNDVWEFQNKVSSTLELLDFIAPFCKPELTNDIRFALPFYLATGLTGLTRDLENIENALFAAPAQTLSDTIKHITSKPGFYFAPCYKSGCIAAQALFLLNYICILATPDSQNLKIFMPESERNAYGLYTYPESLRLDLIEALQNLAVFCALLSQGLPVTTRAAKSLDPENSIKFIFTKTLTTEPAGEFDFLTHIEKCLSSSGQSG